MTHTFKHRASAAKNPVARQLFTCMHEKQTNLCVSLDVTKAAELLTLADQLGPEICVLKTHIDILTDFTPAVSSALQALAAKHQFIIFEDRKFADIGNTVAHQYAQGIYHIANWAPITNAHILPGPGIIEGLKSASKGKQNGLLLIAEMSSKDNFLTPAYTQACIELAEQHDDFVMGFISQHKLCDNPGFVYLTPGVHLHHEKDTLGQGYVTPHTAIVENGTDIIIVGRGITHAEDPVATAKQYRIAAWDTVSMR